MSLLYGALATATVRPESALPYSVAVRFDTTLPSGPILGGQVSLAGIQSCFKNPRYPLRARTASISALVKPLFQKLFQRRRLAKDRIVRQGTSSLRTSYRFAIKFLMSI